MTRDELAKLFDHSILKPDAREADVIAGCDIARQEKLGLVMVQPHFVALVAERLAGSGIKTGTVLSFPHGCDLPQVKARSAAELSAAGADDIDMVINIGAVLDRDFAYVRRDVAGVVEAAGGKIVKVILETCYLDRELIVLASRACLEAGAHFVKTSTGFAAKGATAEDVALMRQTVGERAGVKAAGGIRTLDQALTMLRAGADRIGVSASVAILKEWDSGSAAGAR